MIQEISTELAQIPASAWWAIGILSAVTLAAQVAALVDLTRRPAVLWGRKWVWVLIILFLNNGLGVILWFALGRRVPQPSEQVSDAHAVESSRAGRAVDVLYGARKPSEDS